MVWSAAGRLRGGSGLPHNGRMSGREERRQVLRGLLTLTASALAPAALAAPARAALAGPREDRRLSFLHTHTGERLEVEYAGDGANGPEALALVNRFLRDYRTGEEHPIDPALLDLLHDLRLLTGTRAPFAVISGYRSPAHECRPARP